MVKIKIKQDNARDPRQLSRMRRLAKEGVCFFCGDKYVEMGGAPAVRKAAHWYVRKNDYPYEGTVHHYLVASNKHITKVTQIRPAAWTELLKIFGWLEKKLKVSGEGIFVRSGDLRYTGATLDHLHFHFLVGGKKKKNGKIEDNILVTLGHKK